jgi:hypothetical protein
VAATLAALFVLGGCTSETIFKSGFDSNPNDQPPAHAQPIGTINVDGPPGSVVVIDPPVTPSGKWVKISRPQGTEFTAGIQGVFEEQAGFGTYTFTATVFMPSSFKGLATIQFERHTQPVGSPEGFLHVDLTDDNKVRLNDDESTKFGSFERDQPFIVQVRMELGPTSTARVSLSGAATDNASADVTLPPTVRPLVEQFGAFRVWMGFPWVGEFDVTNIVVKRED